MSGQPHVILEVVEVVTDQLGDDPILFRHLLLHFHHLRLRRAELLLQGLNLTDTGGKGQFTDPVNVK